MLASCDESPHLTAKGQAAHAGLKIVPPRCRAKLALHSALTHNGASVDNLGDLVLGDGTGTGTASRMETRGLPLSAWLVPG